MICISRAAIVVSLVTAALVVQPGDCQGQDSLHISQVNAQLPKITAFIDAVNAEGQPGVSGTLTARVGETPAIVRSIVPFDSSGEGVAYVFLVDVSRSLAPDEFAQLRLALGRWIGAMRKSDQAAIWTFGTSVQTVQDFTPDKQQLLAGAATLEANDSTTQLFSAVAASMELERRADRGLPARRVVVLLSDGINDAPAGLTKEEVLEKIRAHRLPIYAIGYARGHRPGPRAGLETLALLARTSGGAYLQAGTSLDTAIAALYSAIHRVTVVRLECAACARDGSTRVLEVTTSGARTTLVDHADVRLTPGAPATRPAVAWGRRVVLIVAVLCLVAGVLLLLRRPRDNTTTTGGSALAADSTTYAKHGNGQHSAAVTPPGPEPIRIGNWLTVRPTRPVVSAGVKDGTIDGGAARPEAIPVRLAIRGPQNQIETRSFDVWGEHTFGRSEQLAEVAFPADDMMSGAHFALTLVNGCIIVRDLGSTNGTLANGVEINPQHRLDDGDVIVAGATQIRMSVVRSAHSASITAPV